MVANSPGINPGGRLGRPVWMGYVVSAVVLLTISVALYLLRGRLHIADFPIPYILVTSGIAFFCGEMPAVLAFIEGLALFTFLALGQHLDAPWEVRRVEMWAGFISLVVGSMVGAGAMLSIRSTQTRLKTLMARYEEQSALLDTFTQNVPVGLAFIDTQGKYLVANKYLATLNLSTIDAMLGKTMREVLPSPLADRTYEAFNEVLAAGAPVEWQDFMTNLQKERYFNVEFHPVFATDRRIIGVGVVVFETTDQVHARRELERIYYRERFIAETLRTGLIGRLPRSKGCFAFESLYRAAVEEARVGGDFYDVFDVDEGRVGIVIGDVSGKGLEAATQVAMAKYSHRCYAYDPGNPADALGRVNNTLVRQMDAENFVTLFAGILDTRTQEFVYANGGHAPVIHWSAAESKARLLQPTGPLVGMDADAIYESRSLQLAPGDELLLGTDGLFEIECGDHYLDLGGLIDVYSAMKRAGMRSAEELVRQLTDMCQGMLRDDVAVLRVSVHEREASPDVPEAQDAIRPSL